MARKSRIVTFSLPADVLEELNTISRNTDLNRSQLLRKLLSVYQAAGKTDTKSIPTPSDLAALLKTYWVAKSESPLNIVMICLGLVVNKKGEVLIALHRPDSIVANLTWVFPGGELTTLNFGRELETSIENRTGYQVEACNLITSRVFPDSTLENTQIVALYFDCRSIGGQKRITDPYYKEVKWVKPMEVFKYFTSSTSDDVTKFLAVIEQSA